MNQYYRNRYLLPVLLPVGALVVAGTLIFSFSRILLAVPPSVATLIALAAAGEVLIVAVLIAGRRTSKPVHAPVIVVLLLAVVVGGIAAARLAAGPATSTTAKEGTVETGVDGTGGAGAAAVSITAKGIAFAKNEISLKAGVENKVQLDNQDNGVQHNIAIYTDESLSKVLFKGELIAGSKKVTYFVPALPPGNYYFHCDVHPNMNGTVKVA